MEARRRDGAAGERELPAASEIDAEAAPTAAILPTPDPAPIAPPGREGMVVGIVAAVSQTTHRVRLAFLSCPALR